MRYGPAVVEEAAEDCAADKGSDDAPDDDATTEEGDGSRGEADEALNPYSKEEMATWMQLGKQLGNNASSCENGDATSPEASTKASLQGQGPFYPSFNPRPDPEERRNDDEAGKPQLGPDGKCVYSCSYCYKSFSSTSDLSRHMDLHEGVLQHACHTCGHYAATSLDLSRHEGTREHLTRRQNACHVCGRGFDSRSLLDGHAFDCCAGSDAQDLSKSNVQYDERTSRPVCAEANNNDRKFKSRNGRLSPLDVQPATAYPVASELLPGDLGQLSATFFPRSASVGAPFSAIRSLDSPP
ncbi:putative zinc finger protein [Ixodes scapularis]